MSNRTLGRDIGWLPRRLAFPVILCAMSLSLAAIPAAAETSPLDREPRAGEVSCSPADNSQAIVNPPTFVWLPVADAKRYRLEVSRSRDFPESATLVRESAITLAAMMQPFDAGRWYWRWGVVEGQAGQTVFSRVRSFEVTADVPVIPFPDVSRVVKRLSGMRPRIAMLPGDAEKFRARAAGEMAWAVAPLLKTARREIGLPLLPEPAMIPPPGDPTRGMAYTRTFVELRPFYDGMNACAEAFVLTGDDACGQEARRRLLHFMSWNPNGSTSLANHDEQGTEFVRVCSRVFDYAFPLLTDDERAKCRDVFSLRLPQLYHALREIPFESKPFRSHAMGYYVPDLTEACIALAGEIPVEEMLEYCLLQLWSPFYPPFGGADGGWSDGPYYWAWYWNVFARLCAVVERATGAQVGQRPLTRNAPFYKIYGNPPYSKMSPFGDGQSQPADSPQTMFVLGSWLKDPYALWYAEQFKFRPSGITAFLFQPGDLQPRPPDDLPQARCFRDVGLVAMHSALADGARNVQVLLRSSPYGSISHGYADQNAFTLHAFGEPLAIASGYYDASNGPHQRGWGRLTKAANCITANGEGQPPYEAKAKGRIGEFLSNDYAHYAAGDASAAYLGRLNQFDRHVIMIRPHGADEAQIVIVDDLASPQPAQFQWWLHALEQMQIDAGRNVTIQRGAAKLRVQFLAPSALRLEQTSKFSVAPGESVRGKRFPDQWHLTAHADEAATQQQFVTVLLPYREGTEQALPLVKLLDGDNCRAVELRTPTARHVIMFRAPGQTGTMELGALHVDAKFYAAGFTAQGESIGSLELQK